MIEKVITYLSMLASAYVACAASFHMGQGVGRQSSKDIKPMAFWFFLWQAAKMMIGK
jgi:hypothetical protein